MNINVAKKIITASLFLALSACGDVRFQKSNDISSSLDATSVTRFTNPPLAIASGGELLFQNLGDRNEYYSNVGVESLIGHPLNAKAHDVGKYRIEVGYPFMQANFGL